MIRCNSFNQIFERIIWDKLQVWVLFYSLLEQKEKDLLTAVSTQIGLAIENARLLYETREQAHQEQLVSDVSTKLRETLDLDTVLKTAIEEMRRTFNLKEVEVRLSTDDTPEAEA